MRLALVGLLAAVVVCAPAPGGVAPAAPMTTPRSTHTATLLLDGRVLVVGGLEGLSGACSDCTARRAVPVPFLR